MALIGVIHLVFGAIIAVVGEHYREPHDEKLLNLLMHSLNYLKTFEKANRD